MHTSSKIYLLLTLLTTLATSMIWGIDTIFLLSAGLSNAQVFLVNSGFMIGQLVFEVPTGVVADIWGRRLSFLIGCLWLAASTALYCWWGVMHAPMLVFAATSASLGIGFTFFTGATEAWLVDELKQANASHELEKVLGMSQSVGGVAMLVGAVSGGFLAQNVGLPLPYILRVSLLVASFCVGLVLMKEKGFKKATSQEFETVTERIVDGFSEFRKTIVIAAGVVKSKPAVRWLVAAAPFSTGVGFYTFYAAQPFLLQLYGDTTAYSVAGVAAAMVALSRIVGGWLVSKVPLNRFSYPTVLAIGTTITVGSLLVLGTTHSFAIAIVALWVWGLMFAMIQPIRQTFLNSHIPSAQRATVLSMDSLVGSIGGVVLQPGLGWIADTRGYGKSFLAGATGLVTAIPLTVLAGREKQLTSHTKK